MNPQAHKIIIVEFYLEVFRVSLFIFFPKEGMVLRVYHGYEHDNMTIYQTNTQYRSKC
jgi:hypothetical protein